MNDVGYIWK